MKKWLSNIVAVLWFFGVVLGSILFMIVFFLFFLMTFSDDISSVLSSGFATQTIGLFYIMMFSVIFGITMVVPAFRKCFYKLPWLYPLITILMADIAILVFAEEILNYGYSVQNDSRHSLFFAIMIIQMIVCRLAMCLYCFKKPLRIAREDYAE